MSSTPPFRTTTFRKVVTADAAAWDREYADLHIIPSSTRLAPSKALTLFDELIDYQAHRRALDAGCGNGRNAVYLAQKGCQVTALDFSRPALDLLQKTVSSSAIADRIVPCLADLSVELPFKEGTFDICLDSYVSCHFVDERILNHYWSELRRVTRDRGLVYASVFADDDEYYRSIAQSVAGISNVVVDPLNSIAKRLFSEIEIVGYLESHFRLLYFVKFQFRDIAVGRDFRRSVFCALLEKS